MTKASLLQDLDNLKIAPHGTLLVHSSMKSIGDVEGGPDTVLDALSEYMNDGLLVLPTHTWASKNRRIMQKSCSRSCKDGAAALLF